MLHSIPADKIGSLSLEMIIYYMFTEYPEIIYGYNDNMLPLLREINSLEPIDELKSKLVQVNDELISNGNDEEESIFIESVTNIYKGFEKNKKSLENMNILTQKIMSLKLEENNSRDSDINEAYNLVGDINLI